MKSCSQNSIGLSSLNLKKKDHLVTLKAIATMIIMASTKSQMGGMS